MMIITSVTYLLLVTTVCLTQQVEPKNHLFRFIGIKNGFGDLARAKVELVNILRGISAHNISLVSLNDDGADWFSQDIDTQEGCPEDEIRQLLAKIKESGESFTRDFKMALTENFVLDPKSVTIDYRGPCDQNARKRSGVGNEIDGPSSLFSGEVTSQPALTTTTREPASSLTTTEPTAPTTTTDPPTSTPEVPTQEPPAATTNESLSVTTATTDEFSNLLELDDTDLKDTDELKNETDSNIVVDSTTTTVAPTTKAATATTTRVYTTQDPQSVQPNSEDSSGASSATVVKSVETEPQDMEVKSSATVHYGKYIGLAAAFALSVAYFIYSRAFRRQGMYELQQQ